MNAEANKERPGPQEFLSMLYRALNGVSEMIRTWRLCPGIGKGERALSAEENMELHAVQILLVKTCAKLSTAPKMTDVYLHEVCRSASVADSLQKQGYHTLSQIMRLDAGQFCSVLDAARACEEKQWHLYLLAAKQ